jgi:hypothetical protein
MAAEQPARVRQPIDIRRDHVRGTVTVQFRPQVIDGDEEHVVCGERRNGQQQAENRDQKSRYVSTNPPKNLEHQRR